MQLLMSLAKESEFYPKSSGVLNCFKQKQVLISMMLHLSRMTNRLKVEGKLEAGSQL